MPWHAPSEFAANCINASDSICEAFAKLVRQVKLVADQEAFEYKSDGSFTEEYKALICATGCGGQVTTTTGGDVTSTTGGGSGSQNYDTPGTYFFTVPDGITALNFEAVGGGGGGGGRGSSFGGLCASGPILGVASGGGSGQYRSGSLAVVPGTLLTIVVGAGSAQIPDPSGSAGQGLPGNASSITGAAVTVSASGGGGGVRGCCLNGPFAGGAGGSGGSGGTPVNGNAGGSTTASPSCLNGSGGASVGLGAGAGSSGQTTNQTTAGGNGAVHLTW